MDQALVNHYAQLFGWTQADKDLLLSDSKIREQVIRFINNNELTSSNFPNNNSNNNIREYLLSHHDPTLAARFIYNIGILKIAHPDWSTARIVATAYLDALAGTVHTILDICGLIPAVGEPCDLANGVFYTIEGDGINASLSFASTLPIGGWVAAGVKYAGISVLVGTVVKNLNWNIVNNAIDFGNRADLRDMLGLAVGDVRQAHHIIPWERRGHDLVQKAAAGGFHMNHPGNGMALDAFRVTTGTGVHANHPQYNQQLFELLNELETQLNNYYGASNVTPQMAADKLIELQNNISNFISLNSGTKINDLQFSSTILPSVP